MTKLAQLQFINVSRYLKNVRYVGIPWDVHLKIYEGYAKRYGYAQSAERINERGGFGYEEAIEFYPEWDRVVYCTNKWNDDFDQWTKVKINP